MSLAHSRTFGQSLITQLFSTSDPFISTLAPLHMLTSERKPSLHLSDPHQLLWLYSLDMVCPHKLVCLDTWSPADLKPLGRRPYWKKWVAGGSWRFITQPCFQFVLCFLTHQDAKVWASNSMFLPPHLWPIPATVLPTIMKCILKLNPSQHCAPQHGGMYPETVIQIRSLPSWVDVRYSVTLMREMMSLDSGLYHLTALCDHDLNLAMPQLAHLGKGVVMYVCQGDLGTFKIYVLT